MKTIAFFLAAIFMVSGVFAQDNPEKNEDSSKKLTRKEKRKAELESNYQRTKELINSRQFVLEADWLSGKGGQRIPVTSNLNFISVDSANVVIQTSNSSRLGSNGLGGITAEGTLSNWEEYVHEKNKTFSITFEVTSRRGIYTLFLDVSASGEASATLSGIYAGRLVYQGRLLALEDSRVFIGTSH